MRASLLLACSLAAVSALAQTPRQIDELAAKAMRRYRVPGIAVAVVKDGKVLLAKGYGVREMGKPERVDERTLFGIASNTKFFTATALALLVEDGKVGWDAPVTTYLPDFAMFDPWVTKEITVRDLLVHRSGLGLGAGDLLHWPETTYTRAEISFRLRFVRPATSFRSAFAYDNVLYNVAGQVVEKASGMSWEEFVSSRILKKLGMVESVVRFTDLPKASDHASPHADVDGALQPVAPFKGDAIAPAGGIGASARDIAKWLLVHVEGGKGLVTAASERELTTLVTPIPSAAPFDGYALGMFVTSYQGHKLLNHSGGLPGFVSETRMLPDARLGVVVLTNSETAAAEMLAQAILDIGLRLKTSPSLTELNRKEIVPASGAFKDPMLAPLPPRSEWARFAGDYEDAWYGGVSVTEEGTGLVVRFSRSPTLVGDVVGRLGRRYYVRWRNRTLRADATMAFEEKEGKVVRATMLAASPEVDFSYDFADLDLRRKP